MLADYLSAEAAIIARVQSAVPAARHVLGTADLADVIEARQLTPAVHVIYNGDVVVGGESGSAGRGAAQIVAQRWLAVVAVQNVRGQTGGSGVRAEAGPLISSLLTALAGFAPTTEHRELKRVNAPAPLYRPGFAYFPLQFETRIIT